MRQGHPVEQQFIYTIKNIKFYVQRNNGRCLPHVLVHSGKKKIKK